jgi:hypothetical protein
MNKMSVEIPDIEDKIRQLFIDFLKEDWMTDEEMHEIVDEALKMSGITMDKLIKQFIIGCENGYTIEEQFEIIKMIFGEKK